MNEPVSIVIITFNRYSYLMDCLDSVCKSDYKNIEIIIVDDNSNDGTKGLNGDKIKEIFSIPGTAVIVIHNSVNLKLAESRNMAAKTARGKYVIFIDDDNIFGPDMIGTLAGFADTHPEFGIIGPSMYYSDGGKLYMNYQKINLFTGRTRGIKNEGSKREYFETDGVPNVFLVKKEVFNKAGYFDTKLMLTFIEPDLAFNAAKYGYKSCMLKKIKTFHRINELDNFTPRGMSGQGSHHAQNAYCLIRNRMVIVARYGNKLQKPVYFLFFSWLWPLLYSIIMLKFKRIYLIKLYWAGYKDGIRYFLTGELKNSATELIK